MQGIIDWTEVEFSAIQNYTDVPEAIRRVAKSCPFCGSRYFRITPFEAFERDKKEMAGGCVSFGCKACGATIYDSGFYELSYKNRINNVIKLWNTRANIREESVDGSSDIGC